MGWFTADSDAPKVRVAYRKYTRFAYSVATGTQFSQDVEINSYECRGLTKDAADSYADTLAVAGHNAAVRPIGGGGYTVAYDSSTIGNWET